MPQRKLGPEGPEVSVLSIGSWHTWDRASFEEAVAIVRLAVDSGINLFDVGVYRAEEEGAVDSHTDIIFSRIVQAAEIARQDFYLTVKTWIYFLGKRQSLTRQLDEALFRFGTDHADVFILGGVRGPILDELDMDALVAEVGRMIASGKACYWGVNNWSAVNVQAAQDSADAQDVPRPQVAQLRYSVTRRSIAEGKPFSDLFEKTGLVVQTSDSLEGGILAGNLAPAREISGDPGNIREPIKEIAPRLREVAAQFNATPAQLALAFPLTKPQTATVLFGVRKLTQLQDNLGAIDLFERHGHELRRAAEDLWLDRDVVSPEAS